MVIDVHADNVHIFVAWIPVEAFAVGFFPCCCGGESPNEVVDASIGKSSIHHLPQLLACLGIHAPPKPTTTCLMERSPDDRDSLFCQFFQIDADLVDIFDHPSVFF